MRGPAPLCKICSWSGSILARLLGSVVGDLVDKPLKSGVHALSRYTRCVALHEDCAPWSGYRQRPELAVQRRPFDDRERQLNDTMPPLMPCIASA
jgi:hypothetical protein